MSIRPFSPVLYRETCIDLKLLGFFLFFQYNVIDLSSGATESAHNDPQECPRVGVSAFSQSKISITRARSRERLIGICAQSQTSSFPLKCKRSCLCQQSF